jgi:hypothetical protein
MHYVSKAVALVLGITITSGLLAQRSEHRGHSKAVVSSSNCYDPSDPTKLRLWEGEAPGAVGNEPAAISLTCKSFVHLAESALHHRPY